MKRLLAVAGIVLCAGWLVAAAPAPKQEKKPEGSGSQDFVFFADARPVLIRVHAELDGRPLEAAWSDFVDRLFKYIDADGDGVLSKDELERAPTPQALFNSGPQFLRANLRGPAPVNPYTDDDGAGKWNKERFARVFRRIGGAPFQTQSGNPAGFQNVGQVVFARAPVRGAGPASADDLNDAFFDLLDTDKDGKLSRQELAAAPEVLMKLDADEDEVVTVSELLRTAAPQPGFPIAVKLAGPGAATPPAPNRFMAVGPPGPELEALVRELQRRYGPQNVDPAGKALTREDLGLDERTFKALDTDGDGKLNYEELAHFAERPADVELKLRLGMRPQQEPLIEVMKDVKNPAPLASAVTADDGTATLELSGARLVFRSVEAGGRNPPDVVRQQYLAQFKAADRDGNGYLDENEAMQSPFFRNLFKAMDRDGDGKLFEKEVIAYLDAMKDLQAAAAASVASASFSDDGKGLFDLVDTNHDGRLSLREMRQMVKLIDRLDMDGDGKISRSEILKSYQVVFRQGADAPGPYGPGVVVVNPFGVAQYPQPPAPTAGPLWFRKMDRNHDGDVSRKEFLGTDEEFNRLDLDGDGLISVDEAEKADAILRKAKE
jgi:Ca2+-binding EF-hand superfamily protein